MGLVGGTPANVVPAAAAATAAARTAQATALGAGVNNKPMAIYKLFGASTMKYIVNVKVQFLRFDMPSQYFIFCYLRVGDRG